MRIKAVDQNISPFEFVLLRNGAGELMSQFSRMENSILKEHRHHESHGVLIYTRIFISRRQVSLLSTRNINVAMITIIVVNRDLMVGGSKQ